MPTSTVENYIKQLYLHQRDADLVPLGELAAAMQVVPGTVTTMVKSLAEAGLVRYEPRQGVRLTAAGQKLAMQVLRRHRLVELFLVRVLGYDWSDVHDEAENLEHSVSDRLIERIDELLGRPTHDPHGDPIPDAAGKVSRQNLLRLDQAKAGEHIVVARIVDQDSVFLHYVTERGLLPGVEVRVESVDPVGDSITLATGDDRTLTLGGVAARKILVTPAGPA